MDYNKKSNKYKKKYLNLKNNYNTQKGGFYLRDEDPKFFLSQILNKISNKTIFDYNQHNNKLLDFNTTLNYFMNDDDYNSIYTYLMDMYYDDVEYEQIFVKSDGTEISRVPNVHQYHIQFAALIFLNYIIELEIFTLISSIIKTNTISSSNNNKYKSIFCFHDSCNFTRVYKNHSLLPIVDRFKILTSELDRFFDLFMENLINQLLKGFQISRDELLKLIIPVEHKDHI
jgi:hypothetical protein